jgi:peroxiredoxin
VKRLASILAATILCVFVGAASSGAAGLEDFNLHAPFRTEGAKYLGVPENQGFNLSDIDAEYLLIEIFSMYCPYCQAEATHVNDLFEKIRSSKHSDKLKLIGIGAGNTEYEVKYFRDKYDVEFPLFSDGDYAIHKIVGQVGTPYFFLARNKGGGEFEVLLEQEGAYKDTKTFFNRVIKAAGLE